MEQMDVTEKKDKDSGSKKTTRKRNVRLWLSARSRILARVFAPKEEPEPTPPNSETDSVSIYIVVTCQLT